MSTRVSRSHRARAAQVARMKAVDNPDQRVQEDVGIYTERTIHLTYNFTHEVHAGKFADRALDFRLFLHLLLPLYLRFYFHHRVACSPLHFRRPVREVGHLMLFLPLLLWTAPEKASRKSASASQAALEIDMRAL